jgi:hypothetical protein
MELQGNKGQTYHCSCQYRCHIPAADLGTLLRADAWRFWSDAFCGIGTFCFFVFLFCDDTESARMTSSAWSYGSDETFHHSRFCRRPVVAALVKRDDARLLAAPAVSTLSAVPSLRHWPAADAAEDGPVPASLLCFPARCKYICDIRKPFRSSMCALLGAVNSDSEATSEMLLVPSVVSVVDTLRLLLVSNVASASFANVSDSSCCDFEPPWNLQ